MLEIGSLTQNCTITELNFDSYHRLTRLMTVQRRSLAAVHIIAQERAHCDVGGWVCKCNFLPLFTHTNIPHNALEVNAVPRYEAHYTIQP